MISVSIRRVVGNLKIEITELETNETLEIDPVIKLVILVQDTSPVNLDTLRRPLRERQRVNLRTVRVTRPGEQTGGRQEDNMAPWPHQKLLLLGNQPIPSHYQFLCLLINTTIEPK